MRRRLFLPPPGIARPHRSFSRSHRLPRAAASRSRLAAPHPDRFAVPYRQGVLQRQRFALTPRPHHRTSGGHRPARVLPGRACCASRYVWRRLRRVALQRCYGFRDTGVGCSNPLPPASDARGPPASHLTDAGSRHPAVARRARPSKRRALHRRVATDRNHLNPPVTTQRAQDRRETHEARLPTDGTYYETIHQCACQAFALPPVKRCAHLARAGFHYSGAVRQEVMSGNDAAVERASRCVISRGPAPIRSTTRWPAPAYSPPRCMPSAGSQVRCGRIPPCRQ